MSLYNIAGYKFIPLTGLADLRAQLLDFCLSLDLKGTILLSSEGINLSLAGATTSIQNFKSFLQADPRFMGMTYRSSISSDIPFKYMRVKIKDEIITMRRPEVHPETQRAPALTPQEFKQWLDEKRDITVVDTRNAYEVSFGTFAEAEHLNIEDFSEFPEKAEKRFSKDKPVVMFCTGGIRCEKASLHLLNAGFPEVYQLEGGILNYFAEVGGAHYDGECFVFDQRVAVNSELQVSGTIQCRVCLHPVTKEQQSLSQYKPDVSCPACFI